jgi:NADPH:quinone reductase-like Zn-dependent oxidoreductase
MLLSSLLILASRRLPRFRKFCHSYNKIDELTSSSVVYHAALSSLHFGLGVPAPFLTESKAVTNDDMKTVLILGGASGTGASAVQLLRKLAPSTMILSTASPKHFEHVKSLGADHVFDYNSATLVDDIKRVVPEGVNAILDFVSGAAANSAVLEAFGTAEPKKYAAIQTGVDVDPKLLPHGLSIISTTMANIAMLPSGFKDSMKWLEDAVAKKEYRLPARIEIVGKDLEAIPEALQKSFKGVSGRKLVVQL